MIAIIHMTKAPADSGFDPIVILARYCDWIICSVLKHMTSLVRIIIHSSTQRSKKFLPPPHNHPNLYADP